MSAHSLVELTAVTKVFGDAARGTSATAVDDVSMHISAGEVLGLIGESGCGKSTLARLVVGSQRPTSGSVVLEGRELSTFGGRDRRQLARHVQLVFQDPATSLDPRWRVERIVREPLDACRVGARAERRERVDELLDLVGLDAHVAGRRPHELSGGQRQRVGIARALALGPRLVVCDEPIAALDVSIQAQIVNLLGGLRERLGLSLLFIAHDLGMVRHLSDRLAVMYLGRIVETGPAAQVFTDPQHPYTRLLASAVPVADPRREHHRRVPQGLAELTRPPAGCGFAPRCSLAEERCHVERPVLDAGDGDRAVACHVVVRGRS